MTPISICSLYKSTHVPITTPHLSLYNAFLTASFLLPPALSIAPIPSSISHKTQQRNHLQNLKKLMWGLQFRVPRVLIRPQHGASRTRGAPSCMGPSPGEVRKMVGRAEERRLQLGALVSRERLQVRRERLLGWWVRMDSNRCCPCMGGRGEVLYV